MAENYIVSARKYRPQTFDTVVGQEHITTTLKNAIRHQHLAHAYLFTGPRGVGKTTCARILARTINCEHPTEDMEACGICPTCLSFKDNTSFNVFELDAASNNSVEDIRELVNQVRFAPQQGKYKIYIIDEVHMLSAAAFNAFLKTLEEPPPYAIFILATTEKHKILPTILSRCQIFDFKRITTHDIVAHLQSIAAREGMIAQEAALHVIAQKSEGCMRDALSMLDRIASFTNGQLTYAATMEHLNMLDADFYFSLTDHMLSQDVSESLLLLDKVLEKGFEGNTVLEGLAEHMRNLLLCKDQRMAALLDVPNDHKQLYYAKANQVPPSFLISALHVINESELNYKNATGKRLHTEMCLIRLCYLLQATDVKKNNDGAQPALIKPQAAANSYPATAPATGGVKESSAIASGYPAPAPTPAREQPAPPPTPPAAVQTAVEKQSPARAAAPSQAMPAPAAGQPGARRISKNLMGDLEEALNKVPDEKDPARELTDELVQELYERYKQQLREGNKTVYYSQFMMMKAEVTPPDEIRIIAPNELTEEYARNQRDLLIEYFRKETGLLVRVTTEVRAEAHTADEQPPVVLSKTEVYELMAKKNPFLGKLKDGLNLQIDY